MTLPTYTSEQTAAQPAVPEREAFSRLYAALSPVLYGVISRIVQDEGMAEEALEATFLCMYRKGLDRSSQPWQMQVLLPIVFECVENALQEGTPSSEVSARIAAERERLWRVMSGRYDAAAI